MAARKTLAPQHRHKVSLRERRLLSAPGDRGDSSRAPPLTPKPRCIFIRTAIGPPPGSGRIPRPPGAGIAPAPRQNLPSRDARMRSDSFVHLHNHSQFSLLDGAQRIEEMVDQAVAFGMPAVAITDHGNLFGAIRFVEKCKEKGIKPILGCEIYVAPGSRQDRTPPRDGEKAYHHLILLVQNRK